MLKFIKITQGDDGRHKLGRVITFVGAMALTFGFYKESIANGLEWKEYIAYAVGMTIMYAPSKATELIQAIRGDLAPVVQPQIKTPSGINEKDIK